MLPFLTLPLWHLGLALVDGEARVPVLFAEDAAA